MIALTITSTELPELKPIFHRISAIFGHAVPFYNTLTNSVEVASKPLKGIYPVSVLLYGTIRSYQPEILHSVFTGPVTSTPTLRSYQIPVFQAFRQYYNECLVNRIPCTAHLQAPCGFGKSETSLKIITSLKVRTVIIVKTKILVNHWCCYFNRYNISHIGSYDGAVNLLKTLKLDPLPDVLVIVSRHIENEEFVDFLQQHYSFCLVDEVHSWSLTNNSELSKFLITKPFPINLYLTATPNKSDLPALGKIIKADHPPDFINLRREIVVYSAVDNAVVSVPEPEAGEPLDPIQADPLRNKILTTCILDNITSSGIVYCNRRRHVDLLYSSVIRSLGSEHISSVMSDLQSDAIMTTFTIRGRRHIVLKGDAEHNDIHWKIKSLGDYDNFILITTVQFCACGLDLPSITFILLALTSIDENTLKQAVGRAERAPYEGVRRVYLCSTTQATRIERKGRAPVVKGLAYQDHPLIDYTSIYNKFHQETRSIKQQLTSIGWNDTTRPSTTRRSQR